MARRSVAAVVANVPVVTAIIAESDELSVVAAIVAAQLPYLAVVTAIIAESDELPVVTAVVAAQLPYLTVVTAIVAESDELPVITAIVAAQLPYLTVVTAIVAESDELPVVAAFIKASNSSIHDEIGQHRRVGVVRALVQHGRTVLVLFLGEAIGATIIGAAIDLTRRHDVSGLCTAGRHWFALNGRLVRAEYVDW